MDFDNCTADRMNEIHRLGVECGEESRWQRNLLGGALCKYL